MFNNIGYHGSEDDIAFFDIEKSNKWGKFGLWFTSNKDEAELFGSKIYKVELDINNPKIITAKQFNNIRAKYHNDTSFWSNWKNELISQGFDGLKIKSTTEKFGGFNVSQGDMYVAFNNSQVKMINDLKEMKKIKITESQLNYIKEVEKQGVLSEMMGDSEKTGAVVVKKNTNPTEIKKLTDKGLNVSLIDEELGEEQDVIHRYKFDGKSLNVFVTKEKSNFNDIMEFIYTIKDQDKVAKAFEADKVSVFIKDAASGKYKELATKLNAKHFKNVKGFNNFSKKGSKETTELNS